jgi:hypothetical protein
MFNIMDHLHGLEPRLISENPSQLRYQCPVCENKTLTVSKLGKGYQCWSGCTTREIRDWIGVPTSYNQNVISLSSRRKKVHPPPKPVGLKIIKVNPIAVRPSKWIGQSRVDRYNYSDTQYVERIESIEDGRRVKTFRQYSNGRLGKGNDPWDMYMWQYIPKGAGNSLFIVEGEKCVQSMWNQGLATCSPQGSCWGEKDINRYLTQLKKYGLNPVLISDIDLAGIKKKDLWLEISMELGVYTKHLDISQWDIWQSGMDIYDLIVNHTTATLLYLYSIESRHGLSIRNTGSINARSG